MSLKPVRGRRSRNKNTRLEGGHWNEKPKGQFRLFPHWQKIFILLTIVILGSIGVGYGYYQSNVVPFQPGGSNYSQPDPFNVIWDGQIPTSFSTSPYLGYTSAAGPTACPACSRPGNLNWAFGQTLQAPFTGQLFSIGYYTASAGVSPFKVAIATFPAGTTPATTAFGCSGGGTCLFVNAAQSFTLQEVQALSPGSNTFFTVTLATPVPVMNNQYIAIVVWVASTVAGGLTNCSNTCSTFGVQAWDTEIDFGGTTPTIGNSFSTVTNDDGFSPIVGGTFNLNPSPCGVSYNCVNGSVTSGNTFLTPNSTQQAMSISKSAVDFSTGVSKAIAFTMTGIVPSAITSGQEVAWFLRQNGTLPTELGYNPLNDPNVVLLVIGIDQAVTAQMNYYVYMQRQPGQSLTTGLDDPGSSKCQYAGTQFRCPGAVPFNTGGGSNNFHLVLNFTGGSTGSGSTGQSYVCGGSVASGPNTCNVGGVGKIADASGGALSFAGYLYNQTLVPWLNIQNRYYVGMWEKAGGQQFEWVTGVNSNGAIFSVWTPNAALAGTTVESSFFGWISRAFVSSTCVSLQVVTLFLSNPCTQLSNAPQDILNGIITGMLTVVGLLIQGASTLLVFAESVLTIVLNAIGGVFGFPNLGSNLTNFINSLVTLFTSVSLTTLFADLGTIVTRFTNYLSILVPWLPIALNIAINILTLGVNSIVFIPTLIGFIFFFVRGVFATVLIAFWFIYTGDDALGGILAFFESAEWLIFGLGLGVTFAIVNYLLDVVTFLISEIPKPLVQMASKSIPRLPIVETGAHFVGPSFDLGEIRSGNMLSAVFWMAGVTFVCWFESTNPALPGSIGALLPSAATSIQSIAGLLPLLEILTAFVSAAAFIFWPLTRMMELLVGDTFGLETTLGPGRKISAGPRGIRIGKASKHFQGRVERKLAQRQGMVKPVQSEPGMDLQRGQLA